jgi:hypothetical protein
VCGVITKVGNLMEYIFPALQRDIHYDSGSHRVFRIKRWNISNDETIYVAMQ